MIYVRICKSGSTSVSNFVKEHCSILQVSSVGRRVDRLTGWLALERVKHEPCFTVVRNPFARAVSQWQHCIRLGYDYTFEQWLELDMHAMGPKERIHSLRQVDYLRDCTGSIGWVNHILKLEDPELESKIKKLTGATGTLSHMAKGGYGKPDIYTPYAKELVKAKYWMDFEVFGYDRKFMDR